MRRLANILSYASRTCAILAIIAAILLGLLDALLSEWTCFETCTPPENLVPSMSAGALWIMTPFVALELLALTFFLAYCGASGQMRRAVKPITFLVVGGIVGIVMLDAFLLYLQGHVPITPDGALDEGSAMQWSYWFAVSLMAVTGIWSAVFADLQGPLLKQTSTAA